MRREPSGKIKLLAVAAAAAVLVGCYGSSTLIPVLDVPGPADIPPEWERYGAYYIADDLILSSVVNPFSGVSVTTYTVFRKMKVFSDDGAKYGTIIVPQYAPAVQSFDVQISDAQGNRVPVDLGGLRAKYDETGKVVVPSVRAGSTVSVRLVFTSESQPVAFERWFSEPIPVCEGRFLVHTDGQVKYGYDHALYGTRSSMFESSTGEFGGTALGWTVKNLLPRDSTPYCRPVSESEPRIALRISPFYDASRTPITDWVGLSRVLQKVRITPALEEATDSVGYKVAEITRGINSERGQAEAIVTWVQRNITCYFQPVNSTIVRTLQEGKSDMVLAALLCREMLTAVGIEAELVLTRARPRGGFDPSFLTYYPCAEGMLILHLDGKPYAVSPIFADYPIGTYPPEYFGEYGLNLDKNDTMALPPSRWRRFVLGSHTRLQLDSDTALSTLRLCFEELSTCRPRSALRSRGADEQRSLVEQMLLRRGDRNRLVTFSVDGLEHVDKPLEINAGFRNDNPPAELPGMVRYDLTSFFADPFPDMDSSRRDDIVVTVPVRIRDTVEIRKISGRLMDVDAEPLQASNEFFDARRFNLENDTSISIIREITLHTCSINRQKIPDIIGAIGEVNRAGHAAVSLRTLSATIVRKANGIRPR